MDEVNAGETNIVVGEAQLEDCILKKWLADRHTPLEIEIGSGSGHFISQIASAKSQTRFIGIDLNRERCDAAVSRIKSLGLSNVVIVNMEAYKFIAKHVQSNSVRAIHIYFPTPYPRAIGLSKRLIGRKFLEEVYRSLIYGGELRVLTDHKEYFRRVCIYIREKTWWDIGWRPPLTSQDGNNLQIGSPSEIMNSDKEIYKLHLLK